MDWFTDLFINEAKAALDSKVSPSNKEYTEKDPTVPAWAKQPSKPSYTKAEVGLNNVENVQQYSPSNPPPYPVTSVNGKTGSVSLDAATVGARPSTWMPTAQEVGALPNTYTPPNQTAEQVGADSKGTAASAVSQHNTADDAHGDIRLELKAINDRLTAFFDSDNQTLDELSEIVAYITSNKSLIDSITTSKVSVADIINNLTTNVSNKPLSAAQGVALKGLIDAVSNSLANYQPKGNYALASQIPTVPTKVSAFENDKGYLTEHQDISGKLDATALPTAINTALAQAKASGEFDGADGADGKNGTSVTVKSVSESTEDGGSNVVTFSDGKILNVKNGKKGATGPKPVKGTDYFTPADQEAIVQQVISALGTPVFGRVDAEKNIILSTSGVLADGTYKLWLEGEGGKLAELCTYNHSNAPEPTYTNLFDPSTATLNTRMSGSSKAPKTENGYVMTATIMLPAALSITGSSNEHFIAVPAGMWASSANIFLGDSLSNVQGYNDVSGSGATTVGSWAKIPLFNKWGNSFSCDRIVVSLYVKGSTITASDIQNIEIYFNEIPE